MTVLKLEELSHELALYLQRVQAGETIVIVEAGKPVAELKPIQTEVCKTRPFGLCAGKFVVPDDFDAPLPDQVIREFEGV